ncbi:hypothetical protein QBC37DRAFT_388684 [Rhypophila decipiens]|uniref:Uncharacterized protein n=1 Tax=Rhypophila decipiens TaxID=261697 RepID=A0AAN6Y4W1_9PEZI|nr:hypothetical protein QBC37DRAFT_388684 [Rhypophila decipiens]
MANTLPTQPANKSLGETLPTLINTAQQVATAPVNLAIGGNSSPPGAEENAVKDRIDDAIPKGPKKADQSTGGRVMVAEQGDLNELAAARKQSTT